MYISWKQSAERSQSFIDQASHLQLSCQFMHKKLSLDLSVYLVLGLSCTCCVIVNRVYRSTLSLLILQTRKYSTDAICSYHSTLILHQNAFQTLASFLFDFILLSSYIPLSLSLPLQNQLPFPTTTRSQSHGICSWDNCSAGSFLHQNNS